MATSRRDAAKLLNLPWNPAATATAEGGCAEIAPPACFKKPRIDIETKLAERAREREREITRANCGLELENSSTTEYYLHRVKFYTLKITPRVFRLSFPRGKKSRPFQSPKRDCLMNLSITLTLSLANENGIFESEDVSLFGISCYLA